MGNSSDNLQVIKDSKGNRFFIRRCNKNLLSIGVYNDCLNKEIDQAKKLDHINLPQYLGLETDEKSKFVKFKYRPALPLYRAIIDNSFNINNKKDTAFIINQLIDVVWYLHQNGVLHLNINPYSIYVSKKEHIIYLFNPFNTYVKDNISYASFYVDYSDPRLFYEGNVPDERCDIYSIGKIMEYVYSYSNVSLWTKYIIHKATNHNITKRYRTIDELRKDIARTTIADYITYALKIVAVIGFIFFMYLGLKDDNINQENYEFREQTKKEYKIHSAEREKANQQSIASTPIDSIIPIDSISKAASTNMFIKEFEQEASKSINSIYTKKTMNESPEKFQELSMKHFYKLDKLQKELALKYHINLDYSTKISSDIIEELTNTRLNELKKK